MKNNSILRMIIAAFFMFSFSAFASFISLSPESGKIHDQYIVVFSSKVTPEYLSLSAEERLADVENKINKLKEDFHFEVMYIYESCLLGFSAKMDKNTADAIARNAIVELVESDRFAYANAQALPTGINRIDADRSSTIAGNGSGVVGGVDIFIIDTGIQTNHPDLNVVEGANFNSGSSYDDLNGHGTHVAGITAARDNTSYVVGVAPGANLYAVRVLGANGSGSFAQVLAGVNWVTNRKLANPSRPMVANLSLGAYVGTTRYNSLDVGIRNSIARGIVYTIAAGNNSYNAAYFSPAHVSEALTIGAYTPTTNRWASFSNYGAVIDMLAPGVSILSTYKGSSMAVFSGTSMSAPHVAGSAALYMSTHPTSSTSLVRSALLNAASSPIPGPNPTIIGVRSGTTNRSVYSGNF